MATKTQSNAKAARALATAREELAKATTWQERWNRLYGIGGQLNELFPSRAAREAFARTKESRQIDALLEKLQGDDEPAPPPDPKGRFVLRLPASMLEALLEALKAEARAEGVSINQLCVAKLATRLRSNLFLKC